MCFCGVWVGRGVGVLGVWCGASAVAACHGFPVACVWVSVCAARGVGTRLEARGCGACVWGVAVGGRAEKYVIEKRASYSYFKDEATSAARNVL